MTQVSQEDTLHQDPTATNVIFRLLAGLSFTPGDDDEPTRHVSPLVMPTARRCVGVWSSGIRLSGIRVSGVRISGVRISGIRLLVDTLDQESRVEQAVKNVVQ